MKTCQIGRLIALLFVLTAAAGAEHPVVDYIESCRKLNGAFGPIDQGYTDAAWNYPAVAALRVLGEPVKQPEAILTHGVGRPKGHAGPGHWQFFHRYRIQQLLGAPVKPVEDQVRFVHQGYEIRYYGSPFGTGGDAFFNAGGGSEFEFGSGEVGFYNLSSLYYLLAALEETGPKASNPAELIDFVLARQAPNGGFVDLRAAGAKPVDGDVHLAHTFHALAILDLLEAKIPILERCADFIRASQSPSGAFVSGLAGAQPDVFDTWTALRGLELLNQKPDDPDECASWINALRNQDGGFGDRPRWRSRLYSTYYAIDSLRILSGDARDAIEGMSFDEDPVPPIPGGRFEIFQALFKIPEIAPDDLAGLRERGFNLLGLKSADFELVETLRTAVTDQQLPMDLVLCPEAYPHRARREGGALLHHIANPTLAPEQRKTWSQVDQVGPQGLPWNDYRIQVVEPLKKGGSLVYPEQDFEMEFAYRAYDNTYNAFLAGFNWAPSDFVRVFPWRERYVDKLTPIADADAHGDLAKWSPQLDHTRNLFLAQNPSYQHFLDAAADGRVVCVIPDPNGSTPAIYGAPAAVEYVRARIDEWKWW